MLEGLPCPGCSATLDLQPSRVSQRVRCVRCGHVFHARVQSAEPAVARRSRAPARASRIAASQPVVEDDLPLSTAWELLRPGTDVGGYVIERRIATGGAATVYAARHGPTGVPFALKVLREAHARNDTALRRFRQELELLQAIAHPGIVRAHDLGSLEDGRPYLVLDWLEGMCLRDRLGDETPVLAGEAFALFAQLCEALAAVHEAGVVHRDLKPENVFVALPGGRMQAKLVDFGAAKVLGLLTSSPLQTAPGMMVGSFQYMAPEQLAGEALDARADLFALGLMMHETFTGGWPWPGDPRWGLEARKQAAPKPDVRLGQRSRLLSSLIAQCLAPRPEDRPASSREVAAHLAAAWKEWPARATVVGDRGIMTMLRLRTRKR